MIDVEALDVYIEREMRTFNVPALALAILEGSNIVYARGFGVTRVEGPGTPVTPDTIFCCGSISKSLTAATALCLVDRGLRGLDVPVTSYVPWLSFSRPDFAPGVTLRRLLSHSSGLFGTAGNFGPRDLTALETCIRDTIPRLQFLCNSLLPRRSSTSTPVSGLTWPDTSSRPPTLTVMARRAVSLHSLE